MKGLLEIALPSKPVTPLQSGLSSLSGWGPSTNGMEPVRKEQRPTRTRWGGHCFSRHSTLCSERGGTHWVQLETYQVYCQWCPGSLSTGKVMGILWRLKQGDKNCPLRSPLYFKNNLFICLCLVLIVTCGIQLPDQVLNSDPLHWKLGVLATGPPGKSPKGIL